MYFTSILAFGSSRGEPRLEEHFTEINRDLPFYEGLFSSVIESSIRILPRGGSGIKRHLSRRGERDETKRNETKRRIAAWLSRKSSCRSRWRCRFVKIHIPEKRACEVSPYFFKEPSKHLQTQAKPRTRIEREVASPMLPTEKGAILLSRSSGVAPGCTRKNPTARDARERHCTSDWYWSTQRFWTKHLALCRCQSRRDHAGPLIPIVTRLL